MEKRIRLSMLYDLYGTLLTDKRSQALRLYLEEDLSLSEIAESMGISRQAVHDSILRAENSLEQYEQALGLQALLARQEHMLSRLRLAQSALQGRDVALAEAILSDLLAQADKDNTVKDGVSSDGV